MKSKNKLLFAIGIDLGGTYIKAAIFGNDGSIHLQRSIPTNADKGPESVIKQLNAVLESFTKSKTFHDTIVGIGIGSPGSIDHVRGRVQHPPNLPGWNNVPLADIISKKWNIPVRIENDANAAAIGEGFFGAGKSLKNFIGITIGTGIGSGIIMNKKIVHGERGFAGELGHTSIDFNGPQCNCGSRGCVEAYVGNSYLINHTLLELKKFPSSILFTRVFRKKFDLTPKEISRAANQGDVFARNILISAGEKLGIAFANAANLLDISTFIIGGGIAAAGKPLLDGMIRSTRSHVLTLLRKRIRIIPAELGNNAGMLGAAALWF